MFCRTVNTPDFEHPFGRERRTNCSGIIWTKSPAQAGDLVQNKKATKAQVDELRTWGEIYDEAKDEIRHMIIGRLVERMDVEEGNKITIKYRVSFEQFMNKEQASA